jgi:NADH-quinone oxidoreductase subunit M
MLPLGLHRYGLALAAFGAVGVVYGAAACLAQLRPGGDVKRLVAYSSVGHMGFVLIGIGSMTRVGVDGALFASVAHGLITGLLFFLAGGVKERIGTTDLYAIGRGLYGRARRYGVLVAFAAMASLGLPGLAGFWGELYVLIGAYKPAPGLNVLGFHILMGVAGLGMVLTAAYLLMLVRRICMAPPQGADAPSEPSESGDAQEPSETDQENEADEVRESSPSVPSSAASGSAATGSSIPAFADLTPRELISWLPLGALILAAGLWPAIILAVADPAVHALFGGVR